MLARKDEQIIILDGKNIKLRKEKLMTEVKKDAE